MNEQRSFRVSTAIIGFLGAVFGFIFSDIFFRDIPILLRRLSMKKITFGRALKWCLSFLGIALAATAIGAGAMFLLALVLYRGDPFDHRGYLTIWACTAFAFFLAAIHRAAKMVLPHLFGFRPGK